MELRRITFDDSFDPPISIDCWPPFPEVNPLFRMAFDAFVRPYQLAIDVGKLSEESAVNLLVKAYAEAVVAKSTTAGFEKMKPADWVKFFSEHPNHFAQLQMICQAPSNWDSVLSPDQGSEDGEQGFSVAG